MPPDTVNPWETVPLSAYETHMADPHVGQLQVLSALMKRQLGRHSAKTVCVLGVAGGNGLEHIDPARVQKVYGVDISADYLKACAERFSALGDRLELVCLDLSDETNRLPQADLVIANLLIEYVGVETFARQMASSRPAVVCCAVQQSGGADFVSASPCANLLQCLDVVHQDVEPEALVAAMARVGYVPTFREECPLLGGKKLVCIDFVR